ncbi:ABC-type multidrug/protein/lipid transport system ATPase component [Metamycoplasma arthritidis]|uniref:ABC-type multidrug transport system n=1 Tax=Metamycoplasma arthritidis (strain 158L3-1) TaxID=243272 RepID=B3PN49_META1|nr:ABC transporter ATP-binding protein [Metamycoplasma arthritidis]ACF07451.1 ABC-type multidrug transport system [Metamycoplasma arthritidis 158L3-1]VEU78972.1 ABC-type multidrug/protein/lipid transport system ATPase component [Metamycoplasma arthritidis]
MWKLMKLLPTRYKWGSFLAILFTIIQTLGFLMVPNFLSALIQISTSRGTIAKIELFTFFTIEANLTGISLGIISLLLFATLAALLATYIGARVAIGGAREIRNYLWEHIGSLSQKDIDTFTNAKILTRFTIDIQQIQEGIRFLLRGAILGPINLIMGLILAFFTNVDFSLVLVVIVPIVVGVLMWMGLAIRKPMQNEKKFSDDINVESQEGILGAKVIKSYNLEEKEKAKFQFATNNLYKASLKSGRIFTVVFQLLEAVSNFASAAILIVIYFATKNLIVQGQEAEYAKFIKDINTFLNYIIIVMWGLIISGMAFFNIWRARVSSKRIFEILNKQPDIPFVQNENYIESGKITFKNVSFRYYETSEKNILEDISFEVNPGEVLGIIGPTGSGKSTIAKLLSYDYKTHYGEVYIDDKNVKEIDSFSLKKSISHVYQKPTILSGTIKSNLLFANEDATEEEILNATKISCAYNYISKFKKTFGHEIEQQGANLSGGQKQRLAIAQGILHNPKILILDDSTSALDAKTEALVKENIKKSSKENKMTTVIIAQKISSIIDADKIIVLDHGKISDIGTHDELMKNNELYKEIALTQMGGES